MLSELLPTANDHSSVHPGRLLPWAAARIRGVPVAENLSNAEWHRVEPARQPLLLRGFVAGWKPTQSWSFEELARRVGPRPVPAVRVLDGLLGYRKHEGMDYDQRPFDEVAQELVHCRQPRWFLQLSPDLELPEVVADLEVPVFSQHASWTQRRLTMAAAGTTTPIHRELPDNLFTVFYGQKEVALFSPSDSRNLYGYGPLSGLPHLSRVDPRSEDLERYPRLRRCKPFLCRLSAGDALFIPGGWWHAVYTIEPSIALGSWWASGLRSLLPRAATVYKRLFGIRT